MKFEEVLPALRAGKSIKRKSLGGGINFDLFMGCKFSGDYLLADDWEVVSEPKRVADYFCLVGDFMWDRGPPIPSYVKRTLEIGTQPVGAVLVPGSEREEKANLPEEEPMRVEFPSVVGTLPGVPDEGSVNSIYLHALKGKRVKVTAEELP